MIAHEPAQVAVPRDEERIARLRDALARASLDALLCTEPEHVLLLTGAWPVLGTALALATADGQIALATPEDEAAIACAGWADVVVTFEASSLDRLAGVVSRVKGALRELARGVGLPRAAAVGLEPGPGTRPGSYVATFHYGAAARAVLADAAPTAVPRPAGELLARLRARLTPGELARLRAACAQARHAYVATRPRIHAGLSEVEVAGAFTAALLGDAGEKARGGAAWCMAGPDAARASAAYQKSGARRLSRGDAALVHVNSVLDGFWTDITRTYCVGPPDARTVEIADALEEAGRSALEAVRPGARAADVDRAARAVLERRGLGEAFRHATGHGVGFAAIDAAARPRIHPRSPDVLETGMVFNVEPAVYLPGVGGWRHCDMVAVAEDGPELLTPFQRTLAERIVE